MAQRIAVVLHRLRRLAACAEEEVVPPIGEEGGPKETEGGQEESYHEEEMSGLKKQKQLTRVCAATNPSPGCAANGRGDSRPERAAGEAACVWDYGLNYV